MDFWLRPENGKLGLYSTKPKRQEERPQKSDSNEHPHRPNEKLQLCFEDENGTTKWQDNVQNVH